MLDAYIIERIRHREAREQDGRIPLRIEQGEAPERREDDAPPEADRGVVEVDFSI